MWEQSGNRGQKATKIHPTFSPFLGWFMWKNQLPYSVRQPQLMRELTIRFLPYTKYSFRPSGLPENTPLPSTRVERFFALHNSITSEMVFFAIKND